MTDQPENQVAEGEPNELDVVRLPGGREGTIVHDFGERGMVEICDEEGRTLATPIVPYSQVVVIWRLDARG